MFGEGYFSVSFEATLGFVITLVSVWLVVRQLQDSRLASQMEGFLEITARFSELSEAIELIDELGISEEWENFNNQEAYEYLVNDKVRRDFYKKICVFYEGVAALINRGVFDEDLAETTFGGTGVKRFQTFQKAIEFNRERIEEPALYENWERMAERFSIQH